VFTNNEGLALAGFLADYSGLTHQAMPAPPVRHPATPSPAHDHIHPPAGDRFRLVASRPFNPRERHAGPGAIENQSMRLTANSPRQHHGQLTVRRSWTLRQLSKNQAPTCDFVEPPYGIEP
jgi:hypothetical protein